MIKILDNSNVNATTQACSNLIVQMAEATLGRQAVRDELIRQRVVFLDSEEDNAAENTA